MAPTPPSSPTSPAAPSALAVQPPAARPGWMVRYGAAPPFGGDGISEQVSSPSHPTERFQSSMSTWQTVQEFHFGLESGNRAWTHRIPSSLRVRWSGTEPLATDRYRLEERNGMVVLVFEPGLNNNGSWFWIEVLWNYTGAELTPTLVRHRYRYDTPALAGTESLRGYRQALVTVTPQPGQQLTALNLQDESWASNSLGSWLDVAIASPVLSALQIGET